MSKDSSRVSTLELLKMFEEKKQSCLEALNKTLSKSLKEPNTLERQSKESHTIGEKACSLMSAINSSISLLDSFDEDMETLRFQTLSSTSEKQKHLILEEALERVSLEMLELKLMLQKVDLFGEGSQKECMAKAQTQISYIQGVVAGLGAI